MPTFEMMELGEGLEEQFDHLVEKIVPARSTRICTRNTM